MTTTPCRASSATSEHGRRALALRDLTNLRPVYIVPRDDLVSEVLIPCLGVTNGLSCMFGYFSSNALRDIAPGLAIFLGRSTERMRLLVSPNLSPEDLDAMRRGISTPAEVIKARLLESYGEACMSESALVRHTLECLAYLLASGRLEIKVTFLPHGLFHDKVWFFADDSAAVVAHGSSNMTAAGLTRNHEQIRVEKSWEGADQATVIAELSEEYEALWDGRREYAVALDLPVAIEHDLIRERLPDTTPTFDDFKAAWHRDYLRQIVAAPLGSGPRVQAPPGFSIPDGLVWDSGDFAHQGMAVRAWEDAGRRAILEMATGSGKTITALVATKRLHDASKPMLVVIAVPILPLVEQWAEEVTAFGLRPVVPGRTASRRQKFTEIDAAVRRLRLGATEVECLVITHDLLTDEEFKAQIAELRHGSLLIADEVHNLGSARFISDPPTSFTYRLGLSATPVRQYDDEGTAGLVSFFGEVAFSFTLEDAIGTCLVPYDYYVHVVELSSDELASWLDLTEQIRRIQWKAEDGDSDAETRLQLLRNRRRLILENAEAKMQALREALEANNPRDLRHALIYGTDKGPGQLEEINRMLRSLGIRFHQLTADETSNPRLAGDILRAFRRGDLQVLTAKRVLDEGVNVPEVATAYIVASTTVIRQWVQRRGRVLRKCAAIGKEKATLHDFLVVPPGGEAGDEDIRSLLRGEFDRIAEFGRLSVNAGAPDGALSVVHSYLIEYFG